MGYQFFEFQSSRGNQINCALMRIRVDDRTVDVQFFFIDVHQGEGNGGADLRYAEQKNRPTRPGTFDCLKCCLRIADALNNGVGAVRAKNLTDLFRKTFVDRINDRVCANLCSDFSPDCDRLTQKHVCCATQLGQLHHQEPNRAASDHKNVAAGADTGLINAVHRTGKRFDHRSCVQVGILRQHEALCLRQNAEFRKAAIRVDTQRKQMLTVLLSAFPAGAADTAVHVGIRRDFVAGAAGCDRRANCGHNAGKLMSEHDRRRDGRRARLAFVNMKFGEWSIVRRPTSTKTGERVRSCTICNYEETEELPVTGGYVLPYYKLTFETNGGSSLEPVVKIKGTVIDLAEYSAYRYGYTFDGWYADEALTQRVTSVTLDADKTVYAAWTRNRFFEDVTIADWFYDDVMFVCGRGVMQGVSDTRFGPHLTATRAMMATILWRMEGSPAPTAEARFTDVRSGQWYSEAVAWTAQSGVYTGYADGSFRPNDSITREQLAAILYRYAKYKGVDVSVGEDTNILSYADAAEISDYAFPAMQWACGAGVMQGSNGNLLPRGRATRAQIAAMLHRYLVK